MQNPVDIDLLNKTYSFVSIICIQSSNLIAQIAQSVEQRTENPCVGGSIPPLGTTSKMLCFTQLGFISKILHMFSRSFISTIHKMIFHFLSIFTCRND
jgi:hypothetical protein